MSTFEGAASLNYDRDMQIANLKGVSVHMTGIKGSGMVALAQILSARGALVRGSDTSERFYTDEILADLNIEVIEGFAASNVRDDTDVLYYSAAYDPHTHPELLRARELGILCFSYNDALGRLSEMGDATGIAGVHGKSTSTALAGALLRALDVPATVVVGSMVPDFGNRAAGVFGEQFFVAETCEYRRHFLAFHPDRIMVTSIEADHLDYFCDYDDVFDAFESYALRLSNEGLLVYCADDPGARQLSERVGRIRPDIRMVSYGVSAEGRFGLENICTANEKVHFELSGFDRPLSLSLPGRHNAVNAAGVLAVVEDLLSEDHGEPRSGRISNSSLTDVWDQISGALASFRGLKRRSERVGEAAGVVVIDDYAHHPTAIQAEINALREFFPDRRLVVDFMSHTYSRTSALLESFADALAGADVLMLHRIYASARETNSGNVRGEDLAHAVRDRSVKHRNDAGAPTVFYVDDPLDSVEQLRQLLQPGDVFVTMGAGDNWRIGKALLESWSESV